MAEELTIVTEPLQNFKNYFVYADNVKTGKQITVNVPTDITATNVDDHIIAISNILKDGIETPYVHDTKITISWGGDLWCELSFIDYWFSLFMWSMVLKTGGEIRPKHIFWGTELKRKNIKTFIDRFVLTIENKINIGNYELNNIIADGTWNFSNIEPFSFYLANTINNEDDIELMKKCPEYYDYLHMSFANVPFSDVKDIGQEITNKTIDIIKDSKKYLGYEHGLTNSFRASEAINPRQYKESRINIGTKSIYDKVFPYVIDQSFSNGGVNRPLYYYIESSTAITAQIMSKTNVGDSGDFARLLGLNNTDTILNPVAAYKCMSRHFVKYEIKSPKHLSMIKNRYYRFNILGMEYLINDKDDSLIGKTVYLRSPMTCASLSSGHGICSRCYGDLYYTNKDINVGKIAAEILSSILTQTLLSAKHLLETKIIKTKWNKEFEELFDIDINCISLIQDIEDTIPDLRKYTLVIDPDNVNLVNDEEDTVKYDDDGNMIQEDSIMYNEYITYFYIKSPNGVITKFGSEQDEPLYISKDLNSIIRKRGNATNDDAKVNIPMNLLVDSQLFYIKINNNEISKTMNDIINVINKSEVTGNMTKDEALQSIVDLVIEGGLDIDSVHLEVILANQIVDAKDILKKPNWNDPATQYKMFTLNQALTNNPSVIISLLYKDLNKTLYNPLTFTKNAPSFFDLFFSEQPQVYMSDEILVDAEDINIRDRSKTIEMVKIVDKK
jgi:hypothetical protein